MFFSVFSPQKLSGENPISLSLPVKKIISQSFSRSRNSKVLFSVRAHRGRQKEEREILFFVCVRSIDERRTVGKVSFSPVSKEVLFLLQMSLSAALPVHSCMEVFLVRISLLLFIK